MLVGCEPGGGAPTIRNDLPYAIVVVDHYGERPSGHSIARIVRPGESVTPSWVHSSKDGYFRIKAYRAGSIASQMERDVTDPSQVQNLEEVFCRRVYTENLNPREHPLLAIDAPVLEC
jgi:hypothetical protein